MGAGDDDEEEEALLVPRLASSSSERVNADDFSSENIYTQRENRRKIFLIRLKIKRKKDKKLSC